MKMEFEGTRQRGRPRKTWWDCVKIDMESFSCPVRMLNNNKFYLPQVENKKNTKNKLIKLLMAGRLPESQLAISASCLW